jgi:hypothetical protein
MQPQSPKTSPLAVALSLTVVFLGVVKTLLASSQTPTQSVEKYLAALTSAAIEKLGQSSDDRMRTGHQQAAGLIKRESVENGNLACLLDVVNRLSVESNLGRSGCDAHALSVSSKIHERHVRCGPKWRWSGSRK